jgi:23S rRNA pseudouridine1911/1915/1917 synthase
MKFTLSANEAGHRVDVVVAGRLGVGRAQAKRLCAEGRVRLDGRLVEKGAVGHLGAELAIELPEPAPIPESNQVVVEAYVDPWLVVVEKPAGQPSHPLRVEEAHTLAQALEARFPEMVGIGYGPREAGLVHRLDTGTSGLLLAARDAETFRHLRALLTAGAIEKHYRALCAVPVAHRCHSPAGSTPAAPGSRLPPERCLTPARFAWRCWPARAWVASSRWW